MSIFDLFVIGGGSAGIAAALAAGDAGARVILVDERSAIGGQLLYAGGAIDGASAEAWLRDAQTRLGALPEVRVLSRTTAVGYYDHNLVTLLERVSDHLPSAAEGELRQRLWKVRAKQVVVATGANERTLVFGKIGRAHV